MKGKGMIEGTSWEIKLAVTVEIENVSFNQDRTAFSGILNNFLVILCTSKREPFICTFSTTTNNGSDEPVM